MGSASSPLWEKAPVASGIDDGIIVTLRDRQDSRWWGKFPLSSPAWFDSVKKYSGVSFPQILLILFGKRKIPGELWLPYTRTVFSLG
jgi:hypothetical protein